MKRPKAFQLYLNMSAQFEALSDAQAGRLIKAIFRYADADEESDFCDDQTLSVFFLGIKDMIRRDFEKYNRRCEINKRNAVLGGAPIGNQNAKKYNDTIESERESRADDILFSEKTTETTQYKHKNIDKHQEKENYQDQNKNQEKEKNNTLTAQTLSLFENICHSFSLDDTDRLITEDEVGKAIKAYGEADLSGLFRRAERSDFLSGRSGKWRGCTLKWLLSPENILRIKRGAYDNKKSAFCFEVDADASPVSKIKPLFDD